MAMSNREVENQAVQHVLRAEQAAGRKPVDVRHAGQPYDVSSPPRKIEVKAFGVSARGAPIPLEHRQVEEAGKDPNNFYLYVVDNVAQGPPTIRVLHGDDLAAMIGRAKPTVTYWPTFRTAEYDSADQL